MLLDVIGFVLDVAGKVLLGISVYFVHSRVITEKKIDRVVIKEIKKERNLVIIGIILIVVGFFMQLPSKFGGLI